MPVVSRKADQAKKGFLDLAPELRNTIYDFALVRPDPIRFEMAFKSSLGTIYRIDRDQFGFFRLNLLRTCAQVFHEATKVFYGANTFRFKNEVQLYIFFSKQITWSVEDFCNIEICFMNSNSHVETVAHSLRDAKNLKHLMMGVGWENILHDIDEAPDAVVAAALRPLAECIYHNQETKNKQEVLATFCFGHHVGISDEDEKFEETEYTAKLDTAVGGRLYDIIPDGEMKVIKMRITPRKLKAFWQVQNLMEEFPGIRQAVRAGGQHVTSATSSETTPSPYGQDGADQTMPDVDMADSGTESNDSEDDESSGGDDESMIDDESDTDEADDSDDMED